MINSKIKLSDIQKGGRVVITSFVDEARMTGRLSQYGLYPGDHARVLRIAPFDGPVLLEVRGMEIALGKNVAERILVEVTPCDSH